MTEETKKKSRWVKYLIFSAVVFLVVFGALRLYRLSKLYGNSYEFEGATGNFAFEVVENNGLKQHILNVYTFEEDGKEHQKVIPLRYGPKEMSDIIVEKEVDNLLLLKTGDEDSLREIIYITQDPILVDVTNRDSIVASLEIMKVIGDYSFGVYKIPIKMAYTINKTSGADDLPIITCNDVRDHQGVILLKIGENNRIYSDNGCIILEAKSNKDLIRVSDRLILDILGVF